jgi:serine/threonine protein kinase
MSKHWIQRHRDDARAIAQSMCASWHKLCATYLPIIPDGTTWRYSREVSSGDPEQGWKLHLSANLLTACEVMQRAAPYLQKSGALFKGPASLEDLRRINCGVSHGYSQIGKFITVYTRSDEEAVALARKLHQVTRGLSAPAVPFDRQFLPGSCVYYRYGAFNRLEMEAPDGGRVTAIRHPEGHLVPDRRESVVAKPDWVSDPFVAGKRPRAAPPQDSPLRSTFRAFRALSQRGKGGVYQAIDLSDGTPRFCLLKEGRQGGEINWDGRDGKWRVRNEERVLSGLGDAGIAVPAIRASFEVGGNYYLVTEFLDGENLQTTLTKRLKRLSIAQVVQYGIQISAIVSKIHAAGWVWRDCKPSNLILMSNGVLRPIDFEGSCPIADPDPWPWNTTGFSPPGHLDICPVRSRLPEDLYAIGATIYFLLTGRLIEAAGPLPIKQMRRNVPSTVCSIVSDLLDSDPRRRPGADTAADRFHAALASLKPSYVESRAHRVRSENRESDRRLSTNGSINKNGNVANRSLHASCNNEKV